MRLTLTALPHASDALFSGTAHISRSRYSIGRGENNNWVLSDAKRLVSKNHCVIEPAGDSFRLIDQSTNGTTVSGRPVDPNTGHDLRNGDEIELGPYRFKVTLEGAPAAEETRGSAFDDATALKITAILHDVAHSGIGSEGPVRGGRRDAFDEVSSRKGRPASSVLASDLGWDGPPPADPDVARLVPENPAAYRELADRMEQGPTHKVLIDLPRPLGKSESAQIIPDNWLEEEDETPSFRAAPAGDGGLNPPRSELVFPKAATILPVENIELNETGALPAWIDAPGHAKAQGGHGARTAESSGVIAAFCDGLGISPEELAGADSVRFFHNAGRALAISVNELQNAQIVKSRAAALLEMSGDSLGRTPWIFSLGGEDKARAVHAVAAFLADAEPRDLELMRADLKDMQALARQLSQTLIGLVENLQQALSAAELEKHVSAAAKAIPSLKRAALWDALLTQSGLFSPGAKANSKPDLMPMLKAELKKHQGLGE